MKLKEIYATLREIKEKNPDAMEYDVVFAKDDEGNGFSNVLYDPCIGHFEDGEFSPINDDNEPNAVCIN